tara:strand:- start:1866 stop:2573 length:708 start_codon:yes stop_codon:yes gene_type:complete
LKERNKHIIAIGGGGFGRNPNSRVIERYILNLSDKKNPNILFIPTASAEDQGYIINFYSCFNALNCNPTHLNLFKRTPRLDSLIKKQDVIFVGGGNTKSMLAVWKEWKLDELIKKAYNNGTILSGVSAGAICWFESGVTDSWASNLNVIDCLGFIEGCGCPHYDGERDRKPSVEKFLRDQKMESCLAIDDCAALHYENGTIKTALAFEHGKSAYRVSIDSNDNLLEKPIDSLSLV